METYGKILIIAMPLFLLLVLFEKWYGWRKGFDTVRTLDMVSSLSSGVTNSTKDVLGLSIAIISYGWLVNQIAIVHIQSSWLLYVIAFFALDFAGYWIHRLEHRINFFWNRHIIHHSSEEFNLACALRQSIASVVKFMAIFLIPAALLGVPPKVMAVIAPIHLFAQFWYHTRHIGKMGWLEYILVTPSHHRVHHALNPEYIDKNFSQIFIVWDRLFGTFQPELKEIQPVYGITDPVRTWNPFRINVHQLKRLMLDCWHARSWKDKIRIWVMPTGWRPEEVEQRFPLLKVGPKMNLEKYELRGGSAFMGYLWVQLVAMLLLMSWLFGNLGNIGSPGIFYYGIFLFLGIFAITELMDGRANAWLWEAIRGSCGLALLVVFPDWFGLSQYWEPAGLAIALYCGFSLFGSLWFKDENHRLLGFIPQR
jgi:sterol desaturase/sphingolipid hydroxylase (fatty acid hydroxylase superfamily)